MIRFNVHDIEVIRLRDHRRRDIAEVVEVFAKEREPSRALAGSRNLTLLNGSVTQDKQCLSHFFPRRTRCVPGPFPLLYPLHYLSSYVFLPASWNYSVSRALRIPLKEWLIGPEGPLAFIPLIDYLLTNRLLLDLVETYLRYNQYEIISSC